MNNSCFSFRYDSIHEFPSLRITLSVLLSITSVTTVSLNSLILYSIWKNPSLHKPSYLLLANLALADLLFGAIEQPLVILLNLVYIKKWRGLFCLISSTGNIAGFWLIFVSLYGLTLISIDRWLAIRLKSRYRSFVTSRRIWMVTVPYWVGTLILLLIIFLTNTFSYAGGFMFLCITLGCLSTITVCYSMAFYSLKKLTSSVSSSSQQPPDNQTNTFDASQYRRSMKTMILVMLTTLLLFLLLVGSVVPSSMMEAGGNSYLISYRARLISQLSLATNCTVNPLLYMWRMQDIREAVKTTVKRILRREHHLHQDVQA